MPSVPTLTYVQALDTLERDPLGHRLIVLLTDNGVALRAVSNIMFDAVVPANRDFNISRVHCTRDTPAAAITMLAEELPVMQERRLVWACDVNLLQDTETARLIDYLDDIPSTTWLLLSGASTATVTAETRATARTPAEETPTGGMRRLVDAAKKRGLVIQFSMSGQEVEAWLSRELSGQGLAMSSSARKTLCDRVGPDLTALTSELEKLRCYVGTRARIEQDDVELLVGASPAHRVFDLSNAIARRDASEGLTVLADLLDMDEPPLRILAYLATHYRGLIKLQTLRASRTPLARMAELTKKPEWRLRRELEAVDHMSVGEVDSAVEAILRADQAIKSGKDAILLLQMLIIHLCRSRK